MERWSVDRVVAAAPDSTAELAGRRLAVPGPWRDTGSDGALIWGECQGSGRTPYQVSVDCAGPRYRCSCPSRKFPCKHALGLLFLWAEGRLAADGAPQPPAYAVSAKGHDPDGAPAPKSPAGQTPEQRAAAQARAARRTERVTDGMAELDRWLSDQIRGGLARAAADPYGWAEPVAARMIDAQASGVASWLRRLPAVIASGPGWPERLLAELAGLHLLARAWARIDGLPADLAATVRARIGFTVARADVLATEPVRDRWVALGVRELDEDQVSARRIWLRGQRTGRWAAVLLFAVQGAPWEMPLLPGMVRDADLHFYPGRPPLRAILGESHSEAEPVEGWSIAGTDIAGASRDWAAALAADPWARQHPVLLTATPTVCDGEFAIIDQTGAAVALPGPAEVCWRLLASTLGTPTTLFGEWSEAGLLPGSIVDGSVHPL